MKDLNSVLLEGTVVRDPLVKKTKADKTFLVMTVASNRYYKKSDDQDFSRDTIYVQVEAYDKLAERIMTSAKKGRGIRVVGLLAQYSPEKKDEEFTNPVTYIRADHIELKPEFKHEEKEETVESMETEPVNAIGDEDEMEEVNQE